jgi:pre-mRNA-splicing factor CDC5/CEF1
MMEARNLRNMTIAQTPLLGDENTPIHVGPGGGTGFEGATPRHQVAFTPNPLATPLRDNADPSAFTPRTVSRSGALSTPLRTPLRDNLSINPGDYSTSGDTPRDQRLRITSAKRVLKAGLSSLPKPENNFELVVPEDDEVDQAEMVALHEEDAAERDAKLLRGQEEQERKALARRSQVVQLNLPRPANVEVATLLQQLNKGEDDAEYAQAQHLINAELVQLMHYDAIAHPIPGTTTPGATQTTYEIPADEDIQAARTAIHLELASAVGFPNANPDRLREGLLALSKAETVDEEVSWARRRQQLAYDAASKTWTDATTMSLEAHVEGYSFLMNESRDAMTKAASKATKLEKRLGVTLGGYQARAHALAKHITDAFEKLQNAQVDFESFSRLRINESAIGPRRVASLKEEVEQLERRERLLQERYAELELERKESEMRVGVLEERLMADAEALNEANLAEIDGIEA